MKTKVYEFNIQILEKCKNSDEAMRKLLDITGQLQQEGYSIQHASFELDDIQPLRK